MFTGSSIRMKWNKQRAPGAAGLPPAALSSSCPFFVFFVFFGCFEDKNRELFRYSRFGPKVNFEGFRNASHSTYELVPNLQKAVSLLISCFALVVRAWERIEKGGEPGSFYTLEPDSWSPARGKQSGPATHHFPSMDTDISELGGH